MVGGAASIVSPFYSILLDIYVFIEIFLAFFFYNFLAPGRVMTWTVLIQAYSTFKLFTIFTQVKDTTESFTKKSFNKNYHF